NLENILVVLGGLVGAGLELVEVEAAVDDDQALVLLPAGRRRRDDLVDVLERIEAEFLEQALGFFLRLDQVAELFEAVLLDQLRAEDLADVYGGDRLGVRRQVAIEI